MVTQHALRGTAFGDAARGTMRIVLTAVDSNLLNARRASRSSS
jgi:hypothetical protein